MGPRATLTDPIARRLRERRASLGLSLAQVSARAGFKAPSFLHHIEHGERVPSEEVVAGLAAALREDEDLLRAWVRLRRGATLEQALAAARRVERHLAEPGVEAALATDGAPPLLMRVPRLDWGKDPQATLQEPAEVLRFDPRALPQEAWFRPFAYRLPARTAYPVPLEADDLVLITRNAWPLHPQGIYLVRKGDQPVLSRAAWREETLWLDSTDGQPPYRLPSSGLPPAHLLGRVGAVIRSGALAQAL